MNTSTETLQPGQQASSASKPLWAAVGILGVAVLAMGGTMIYQMRNPAVATPVALAVPQAAPVAPPPVAAAATAADDLAEKPAAAPRSRHPCPPKRSPGPRPSRRPRRVMPVFHPRPVLIPHRLPRSGPVVPVCHVCGAIESVTPVERSTKPAGVGIGTVAGGVLGAVLGNQVGHGGGRTAATILGAVGGGFAGNAIEGHVRKETVYQVGVRMEDGSQRLVEVARAPSVGSRVTVEGNVLRTNDGATYGPKPPPAPVAAQPAPSPYYGGH
jgi:outer membrane lipoprotein SlyB